MATPARELASNARDPTRTTGLRREYAAAGSKRWRYVKGAIRDGIAGADALGIGPDPPRRPVLLQESPEVREELNRLRRQIRALQQKAGGLLLSGARGPGGAAASGGAAAPPTLALQALLQAKETARAYVSTPGRFAFSTSAKKLEAFSGWLDEMVDTGVLEVARNSQGAIVSEGGWQRVYVQRAYVKGYSHAGTRLRQAGADVAVRSDDIRRILSVPIHSDALELLWARNLEELKGISSAAGQSIRRELAEGFAQGLNPRTTASAINGRVDAIGLARSRTMARTETIRAHSRATLNRYRQHGVGQVRGVAEFLSAGDDRTCPICLGLEGEVFTLREAEGVIPVHPNCRCTWLPVVSRDQLRAAANVRNEVRVRRTIRQVRRVQRERFPEWLWTDAIRRGVGA